MFVFFLDIDGTIYDGEQVAQEVIDAIAGAREAGHKVLINTARAYIGMPAQVCRLPVDGWVCSFGLEVFADGRFIHRRFIPRERVLEIARYAFENGVKLYFEGETRLDLNYRREGSRNPKNMGEFERMLGQSRVCKFSLPDGVTDADRAAFSADFDFYDIEGIAKGYRKSRGMQIAQEYYGASREDTVAIGDTDSDMDMVNYAGIGIAMGSGTPNLIGCAKYVTKTLQEQGAAYAMDRLLAGDAGALEKIGADME